MDSDERKVLMDALDPAQLAGGKTKTDVAEGCFRWHVLTLLADIADSQERMAHAYTEMLRIQQVKCGLAGMDKSRYGNKAASDGN